MVAVLWGSIVRGGRALKAYGGRVLARVESRAGSARRAAYASLVRVGSARRGSARRGSSRRVTHGRRVAEHKC
jgi:hypothetical protein